MQRIEWLKGEHVLLWFFTLWRDKGSKRGIRIFLRICFFFTSFQRQLQCKFSCTFIQNKIGSPFIQVLWLHSIGNYQIMMHVLTILFVAFISRMYPFILKWCCYYNIINSFFSVFKKIIVPLDAVRSFIQ